MHLPPPLKAPLTNCPACTAWPIQVGIGKIPDAVCASLRQHEDLGVHTGAEAAGGPMAWLAPQAFGGRPSLAWLQKASGSCADSQAACKPSASPPPQPPTRRGADRWRG